MEKIKKIKKKLRNLLNLLINNSNFLRTSKIKIDKSNLFSFTDDNISEIKSHSIHEIDIDKKLKESRLSDFTNKRAQNNIKEIQKIKKSKFFKPKTNIIDKDSSSFKLFNNSINNLQNSEIKMINIDKTEQRKKVFKNSNLRSRTFIKKLFQNNKNIKDNSFYRINEALNDLSLLNKDIELMSNNNYEKCQQIILNKFKDNNNEEKKKNAIIEAENKGNICIIF